MSFYGKIFNNITHELSGVLSSLFNIFKQSKEDNGEQLIIQLHDEETDGMVNKEIGLFKYDGETKSLHLFYNDNMEEQ